MAVDDDGFAYVVGGTSSPNFPTTPGVFQRNRKGERDAALVKLKPDGSGLALATLLGGNDADGTMGVCVNTAKEIFVAGHTQSRDFPVTEGAAQSCLGGQSDCYLSRFSSDASKLAYSTYLGGKLNEFAEHRLWLAPDDSILLTGSVGSSDFPTTDGAFQTTLKGKNSGFLTKLSVDGKTFVFSTFLGGSGTDFWLMPTPDPYGNILIVGQTSSRDLPVTPSALQGEYGGGGSDGALAILGPDGSKLLYASYLGGNGGDIIRSVSLGANGEVYLVGSTSSGNFPTTPNAAQKALAGKADAFIVKLKLQ